MRKLSSCFGASVCNDPPPAPVPENLSQALRATRPIVTSPKQCLANTQMWLVGQPWLQAVTAQMVAPHMLTPPQGRRMRPTRLPTELLSDILLRPEAKLGLPHLLKVAGGNEHLEYALFRDTHLMPFAMREEMLWAQEQRDLFLRQRTDTNTYVPRFLQGVIFYRWARKPARELQRLARVEEIMRSVASADVAHVREDKRAQDTEKGTAKYRKEMQKLRREESFVGFLFDCTLTMLRWSDGREMQFFGLSTRIFAYPVFKEPSVMMVMARTYPEFLQSIHVDIVNEKHIWQPTPSAWLQSDQLPNYLEDDGVFQFDRTFEKIMLEASASGRGTPLFHWYLFHCIDKQQKLVLETAKKMNLSVRRAALFIDDQQRPNIDGVFARRAIGMDLDQLLRDMGFAESWTVLKDKPLGFDAVKMQKLWK